MYILGLNAYHGDSSACLVKDGELVAALEEERIKRVKYWAGLPIEAIRFCLNFEGITLQDVDYIALAKEPKAHFWNKVWFALKHLPSPKVVLDRLKNFRKSGDIADDLASEFGVSVDEVCSKIKRVEHHLAHLGSAFFVSPFNEATVVSVDGMGDFVSAMWGVGKGNNMEIFDCVMYPHSLGFFYTAMTQYLGFDKYGDEYKVMGLSAAGEPDKYLDKVRELVELEDGGRFRLNLKYFTQHKKNVNLSWQGGAPKVGRMFSGELENLLGPARKKDEELNERFKNIAAATQAVYEEGLFHILNFVYQKTENKNLCLAGGTAQNSLANGKIYDNTPFENVYIPPAAHDAGTCIGAAFYLWNQELGNGRKFVMDNSYWGPQFSNQEIKKAINQKSNLHIEELEEGELLKRTAKLITDGNVVGWFQSRSEWGPRALGNRSILADPKNPEMKDILNRRIKYREPFRPFAPSILEEAAGDYFERAEPVPFMEKVYMIRPDKQKELPAVTHFDGTGRLQSVSKSTNPLYWKLIKEFERQTGVPIIINTSFNENEPIVNTPEEAIDCFLRTKMDAVVLGNYLITKTRKQ